MPPGRGNQQLQKHGKGILEGEQIVQSVTVAQNNLFAFRHPVTLWARLPLSLRPFCQGRINDLPAVFFQWRTKT